MPRPSGPGSALSLAVCRALLGHHESLCSCAWRHREACLIARLWCALLPGHCEGAFRHWHPDA